MITRSKHLVLFILAAGAFLGATGCRYMANRYYDFRDLGVLSAGVSFENPGTGLWPPALGVYAEVTDFLHLGAIHHSGYVAEWDLRGSGVYWEDRTRLGFLFWQAVKSDQDYLDAKTINYFKRPGNKWERWMKSSLMCSGDAPAKDLTYDHWAQDMQYGFFLRHRGWQYWEYVGGEAAICEPFLTHVGFTLRAGLDVSELSDFILGWFCFDFKRDDLTPDMFDELRGINRRPVAAETPPAPPEHALDNAELERLHAENERLARELAACKGRLKELEGGIEIVMPERVLFESGRTVLKPGGKKLLDDVAAKIRRDYPEQTITVEGHTDDQPIRATKRLWKSNWELSSARANVVLHYLIDNGGLPESRFSTSTFAANRPIAPNDTKAGRQENRRAVIVLKALKKK